MYTNTNLYPSAMKLLKLVHALRTVSFLKKIFFWNYIGHKMKIYEFIFFSTNFEIEKSKGATVFRFERKVDVFVFFVQIVNQR